MVVVNALVYYSKEDKCYISAGYEIAQTGTGKNEKEAKIDYLKTVSEIIGLARKKRDIKVLNAEDTEPEVEDGSTKIILSRRDIKPEIRKVKNTNIEIHFYGKGK